MNVTVNIVVALHLRLAVWIVKWTQRSVHILWLHMLKHIVN